MVYQDNRNNNFASQNNGFDYGTGNYQISNNRANYGMTNNSLPYTAQNINQPPISSLNVKIVESIDIVKIIDIPMDGNFYYFPKADGTALYAKRWLQNGTTEIVTYKPIIEQNGAESTNIPRMDFNALNKDVRALREDILARLDSIEKSVSKPNIRGKKMEVVADE